MKMRISANGIIEVIVYLFLILFIYAAASKLMQFSEFQAQLGKSPLITNYADVLSWLVPGSELIISVLLFVPKLRMFGFYASFSLMLAFTVYLTFILLFSPYVPCSCGGILSSMGWTEHLIFNIVFTMLAIVGIVLETRKNRITYQFQKY